MLNKKTLFVLGAGASCEVGLPSGTALAATIYKKMDFTWTSSTERGDRALVEHLHGKTGVDFSDLRRAAARIRDGILLSNSIDDFLDQHQSDSTILALGKAAITKSILEAERKSKFTANWPSSNGENKIDFLALVDTWYLKLARILTRQVKMEDVDTIFDQVCFVSFNYDRTLEFFLMNLLTSSFALTRQRAAQIVRRAQIIHPYGMIGYLPDLDAANHLDFAASEEFTHIDFEGLSKGIRTYTETTDDEMRQRIHELMLEAQRIVFLGFGYHKQNMELLGTPPINTMRDILATVQGISKADQAIVYDRIAGLYLPKIKEMLTTNIRKQEYDDCSCAELLDRYRLTLTA